MGAVDAVYALKEKFPFVLFPDINPNNFMLDVCFALQPLGS